MPDLEGPCCSAASSTHFESLNIQPLLKRNLRSMACSLQTHYKFAEPGEILSKKERV